MQEGEGGDRSWRTARRHEDGRAAFSRSVNPGEQSSDHRGGTRQPHPLASKLNGTPEDRLPASVLVTEPARTGRKGLCKGSGTQRELQERVVLTES
jgi:hypothetical protein